jgi:hypothetical protein
MVRIRSENTYDWFFLFIGNTDNTISFSNLNDTENSDDQRRSNADLELISRQVTESAISDDGKYSNLSILLSFFAFQ